jgi:hypothetical protein
MFDFPKTVSGFLETGKIWGGGIKLRNLSGEL